MKQPLLFTVSIMLLACESINDIDVVETISENCKYLGSVNINSFAGVSEDAIVELRKEVHRKKGNTLECCYVSEPISTWGVNKKTGKGSAVEITEVSGKAYACRETP